MAMATVVATSVALAAPNALIGKSLDTIGQGRLGGVVGNWLYLFLCVARGTGDVPSCNPTLAQKLKYSASVFSNR